jgi:hypothetical protein
MGRRLNCKQRDNTVTGTFCGSVVANTNFKYSGGSSSVFNIALNAVLVSMCTSSIMNTLKRPCTGLYTACSSSDCTSSTPRFDAASSSV